jgi:protein-S-isoprenylcysteine O-methyltransferase Ste14
LNAPALEQASLPEAPAASAGRLRAFRRTKLYDLLTALPVVAWFGFCAAQGFSPLLRQVALAKVFVETDPSLLPPSLILEIVAKAAVLLFQALLVVLFVVRYVPRAGAHGFLPRLAAIAGTFLGLGILLLPPQELSVPLHVVLLVLIIGGFAFMTWAAVWLGRSISLLPEARQVVTGGPYAIVRHPLYLGEAIAVAGIALHYAVPWSLAILGLQYAFQLLRLHYEERVLQEAFPDYAGYAARTARLIPGLY